MNSPADTTVVADPRHVTYTHLMYGLHAFAILTGILTAASIVGQFVFSLPSIIAVIMNYVRRRDVRGTWLESHFRWQLRTFWWAVGWMALAWVVFGPLTLILIGIPFLIGSYIAVGLWTAYRMIRGWLALRDNRSMPA
jgi:uncharacterized membrane protein